MNRAITALFALSCVVCLASSPSAQVLVGTSGTDSTTERGVYRIDWSSGQVTTLTTTSTPFTGMVTADGNDGLILGAGSWAYHLQQGSLSSLTGALGRVDEILPTQTAGRYLVLGNGALYMVDNGRQVYHIIQATGGFGCACRDTSNGDYWLSGSSGRVIALAADRTETTLRTGLGDVRGIARIPRTGNLVVGRNQTQGLMMISPNGSVLWSANSGPVDAITVDDVRERIYAALATGAIAEYALDGRLVTTRSWTANYVWHALDVENDRNVTAQHDANTRRVDIILDFPAAPSAAYCVALSLSQRPVFTVRPGHVLNMHPDRLFFDTLCGESPFFTNGFTGTLDATGRATASFDIPTSAPSGTMIYVGAAAALASAPNGLDLGDVAFVRNP